MAVSNQSQVKKAQQDRLLSKNNDLQVQTPFKAIFYSLRPSVRKAVGFLLARIASSGNISVSHRTMGSYLDYVREVMSRATSKAQEILLIKKKAHQKGYRYSSVNEFSFGPLMAEREVLDFLRDEFPELSRILLDLVYKAWRLGRSQSKKVTVGTLNYVLYKNIVLDDEDIANNIAANGARAFLE